MLRAHPNPRHRTGRRCAWPGYLVVVVVLVACGGGVEDGGGGGHDEAITWSQEATAAVVAVDSGGGLPPPERVPDRFGAVPDVVLYGDGTAYWQAEDGFRTARIDQEGVRTVLGWAADAGLLDPSGVDTGEPEVYDVGSVRYDVAANGRTFHVAVAAPGFEDEAVGLTGGEIEARARLEAFRGRLLDLDGELPRERFVVPAGPLEDQAWEVLTRPSTTVTALAGDEPRWEIDDPAVAGRCRVLRGPDARRVATEVGATSEGRIWAVEGAPWLVVARPLLPGADPPCPGDD